VSFFIPPSGDLLRGACRCGAITFRRVLPSLTTLRHEEFGNHGGARRRFSTPSIVKQTLLREAENAYYSINLIEIVPLHDAHG
jgi:hypothetical protein